MIIDRTADEYGDPDAEPSVSRWPGVSWWWRWGGWWRWGAG